MGAQKNDCTTFAPATIAPMINANVERNPNPNPYLNPYPTPNQKPNHHPHSNFLLSEIPSQEQLSPEQMSDHQKNMCSRALDEREARNPLRPGSRTRLRALEALWVLMLSRAIWALLFKHFDRNWDKKTQSIIFFFFFFFWGGGCCAPLDPPLFIKTERERKKHREGATVYNTRGQDGEKLGKELMWGRGGGEVAIDVLNREI